MSSEINQKLVQHLYVSQNFEEKEDSCNGYIMNGQCIPKELILIIFGYLKPMELLKCSEVCDNWNKLIKAPVVWKRKYTKKYNKTPKNWPWFVLYCMVTTDYFDQNLLLNGSGLEGIRYWRNSYDCGSEYHAYLGCTGFLTLNNLSTKNCFEKDHELENTSSCFQAVRVPCSKYQVVDFTTNKLFHAIINTYKPTIYASEWRFSSFPLSSTTYILEICLSKKGKAYNEKHQHQHDVFRYNDSTWRKEEIFINNYRDLDYLYYKHSVIPAFRYHSFRTLNLVSITEATAKILTDSIPEISQLAEEDLDIQN